MSANVYVCINYSLILRPHHHPLLLAYCIAGNFCGRKLSRIKIFAEKTFAHSSLVPPKDTMAPSFVKKTFTNSHKTLKFVKIFPLESFPLHSNTEGEAWEEGHSTHELVGKVAK